MVTQRSCLMVRMVKWWNGDVAELLNGENGGMVEWCKCGGG